MERRDELRCLDNVGGLHDANLKIAGELRDAKDIVKAAKGAKRKIEAAESAEASAKQLLTEQKKETDRVTNERKKYYNLLRHQRIETDNLRDRIAEIGNVDELRAEHEQLWTEFDELRQERDDLKADVIAKEEEIERLHDAIEEVVRTTESSGEYSPEFRQLVYNILGKAPHAHVTPIIRDVLAFAGKTASNLPCLPTIRNLNIERLAISQKQLGG